MGINMSRDIAPEVTIIWRRREELESSLDESSELISCYFGSARRPRFSKYFAHTLLSQIILYFDVGESCGHPTSLDLSATTWFLSSRLQFSYVVPKLFELVIRTLASDSGSIQTNRKVGPPIILTLIWYLGNWPDISSMLFSVSPKKPTCSKNLKFWCSSSYWLAFCFKMLHLCIQKSANVIFLYEKLQM